MANGFKITQETWEHMPKEQRDWIMYETVLAMREDIDGLKTKKWINSGCAVVGGAMGGFIFSLLRTIIK